MTPNVYDYVAWDVATWSRPLRYWEKYIGEKKDFSGKCGLEVGANMGGLSLFFARQFGCQMLCTDYIFPEKAKDFHQRFNLSIPIDYMQVDVQQIPFSDASFDFVVFKSMLGVVGSHGRNEQIEMAIKEMRRVLKPGGILFFAENLKGSALHSSARSRFITWGNNWHYLSLPEINQLLRGFSSNEVYTTGFLAAFVPRPKWLKSFFAWCDQCLFFIPAKWQYVAYGHAVK